MKIGIVTFFQVPNYGAMLQALALWKYLERRGHEVRFIDCVQCGKIRLRNCLARSLADTKSRLRRYLREECTEFAAEYPKGTLKEDYEVLIVGSDQVWNPSWMLPKVPVVFLGFAPAGCKKVSYAASFGVRKWGEERRDEVADLLGKFEAISVRERSGIQVVNDLCGRDAELMPDPTLLWDGDFYRQYIGTGNRPKPGSYVLSFMLEEWADGVAERNCANEVARLLGVDAVRETYNYGRFPLSLLCRVWGIRGKIPLPKWLGLLDGAEAVVTNSFHGMVLSILLHRPFVVIKHRGIGETMNDRVTDLLCRLGMPERAIYADEVVRIRQLVGAKIDWHAVDLSIGTFRAEADVFFKKVGV